MSILFACDLPQRFRALVLSGGMARSTYADDYPWASPAEALIDPGFELLCPIGATAQHRDNRAQPRR